MVVGILPLEGSEMSLKAFQKDNGHCIDVWVMDKSTGDQWLIASFTALNKPFSDRGLAQLRADAHVTHINESIYSDEDGGDGPPYDHATRTGMYDRWDG